MIYIYYVLNYERFHKFNEKFTILGTLFLLYFKMLIALFSFCLPLRSIARIRVIAKWKVTGPLLQPLINC